MSQSDSVGGLLLRNIAEVAQYDYTSPERREAFVRLGQRICSIAVSIVSCVEAIVLSIVNPDHLLRFRERSTCEALPNASAASSGEQPHIAASSEICGSSSVSVMNFPFRALAASRDASARVRLQHSVVAEKRRITDNQRHRVGRKNDSAMKIKAAYRFNIPILPIAQIFVIRSATDKSLCDRPHSPALFLINAQPQTRRPACANSSRRNCRHSKFSSAYVKLSSGQLISP